MTDHSRILFVTQLPPPVHGASSIGEIYVNSKIIHSSFQVRVLPLNFAKSMADLGKFSIGKLFIMIRIAFQLVKELSSFKPHLVYFTLTPFGFPFYRDILYASILKLFRSKVIYQLHVKGISERSRKRSLDRLLYKYVFRNSNVVTLSKLLTSDISNVYSGEPYVVNNGLIPVIKSEGELSKPHNQRTRLLYLSNFMRTKGIFLFLEAVNILARKKFDFCSHLVGKPADVSIAEIEEFINKNNLANYVVIEGAKYGDEKYALFEIADIFIHPTLNDAFPLVVLEAMQFQLPVISTVEGAIPEIVDDKVTGLLVPKNDLPSLVNKIELLLSDETLRTEMGKAGRTKFLTHYTAEVMERNLSNVLHAIVDDRKE